MPAGAILILVVAVLAIVVAGGFWLWARP